MHVKCVCVCFIILNYILSFDVTSIALSNSISINPLSWMSTNFIATSSACR